MQFTKTEILLVVCLLCSCSSRSQELRFDDSGYGIVGKDTVITKTDSSLIFHVPVIFNTHINFSYDGLDFFDNISRDYIADGDGWIYGPPKATKKFTLDELAVMGLKGLYRNPKLSR